MLQRALGPSLGLEVYLLIRLGALAICRGVARTTTFSHIGNDPLTLPMAKTLLLPTCSETQVTRCTAIVVILLESEPVTGSLENDHHAIPVGDAAPSQKLPPRLKRSATGE